MAVKAFYIAAAALLASVGVNAQAAPNWEYIPAKCQSQCAQTIEASYLCSQQYEGDALNTYACFCADYPSDVSNCASCLNSNNAAALASLLTSTQTACPQAQKSCFFACSFDTCASSDVACQCSAEYLANIYNCGSCNTANGNTGATQLTDFQSLDDSCKNQNYTGATQSFTTKANPTPSTNGYVAPSLTASGGGAAATGNASDLGAVTDSGSAAGSSTGKTVPTTSSGAGSQSASIKASSTSGSSKASSGAASSASSGAAAAASSSKSAAGNVVVPAGGVLALMGAIVALL